MTGPAPGSRRPGGRTARVRAAVIAAVLAEIAEHGFSHVMVDAVAARAGVHRATVHRRWSDVGGLLADALSVAMDDDWAPPDTGSLHGDLGALGEEIIDALTRDDSIVRGVIAAASQSPVAASGLRAFLEDRYERSTVVVDRAKVRNEVSENVRERELLVLATAPIYHHVLLMGDPPDRHTAHYYAELAAAAFKAN